jgi:hypothetical protein
MARHLVVLDAVGEWSNGSQANEPMIAENRMVES